MAGVARCIPSYLMSINAARRKVYCLLPGRVPYLQQGGRNVRSHRIVIGLSGLLECRQCVRRRPLPLCSRSLQHRPFDQGCSQVEVGHPWVPGGLRGLQIVHERSPRIVELRMVKIPDCRCQFVLCSRRIVLDRLLNSVSIALRILVARLKFQDHCVVAERILLIALFLRIPRIVEQLVHFFGDIRIRIYRGLGCGSRRRRLFFACIALCKSAIIPAGLSGPLGFSSLAKVNCLIASWGLLCSTFWA